MRIDQLEKENRQLRGKLEAAESHNRTLVERAMAEKNSEIHNLARALRAAEAELHGYQEHQLRSLSSLFEAIERVGVAARVDGKEMVKRPKGGKDLGTPRRKSCLIMLEQVEHYIRVRAEEYLALQKKHHDLTAVHATLAKVHAQHGGVHGGELDRLRNENKRLQNELRATLPSDGESVASANTPRRSISSSKAAKRSAGFKTV